MQCTSVPSTELEEVFLIAGSECVCGQWNLVWVLGRRVLLNSKSYCNGTSCGPHTRVVCSGMVTPSTFVNPQLSCKIVATHGVLAQADVTHTRIKL